MEKKFKLTASEILSVAVGYGGCIASDKITVCGEKVHFMYREKSELDEDSGWIFLSGTETHEYINDAKNLELYNVNTIANYDKSIIPYLDYPIGTSLERIEGTDQFKIIDDQIE